MKDGEKVVNQSGGSQSFVSARFDCIPPVVLRLLAQCLGFGARRYGCENWKKIPIEDHLNHAMNHINEWRAGDRSEPHLVNAMARITFALWQAVDSGQQEGRYIHPSEVKKEIADVWAKAAEDFVKQLSIPTVLCSGVPKKPSPEPCPSTDGYPDQESQVKGY